MNTHQHQINAAIQMLPIVSGAVHPYAWVDKVIDQIAASGLVYEVGPFSTSVEGDYELVMKVINSINKRLLAEKCPEWILSVQLQMRSEGDITAGEKTSKFI